MRAYLKKVFFVSLFLIPLIGCILLDGSASRPELEYGLPSQSGIQLLCHTGYSIGYSRKTKQAKWTIHLLTKEQMEAERVKRSNDFRENPMIMCGPTPEDYRHSGYDRGHMVPAGDVRYSKKAMSECFYMTNMSPQASTLNQKKWNDMEIWIREAVLEYGKFVVVTGPVFENGKDFHTIGKGKVGVPHAYFKILFRVEEPRFMIAFLMRNEECSGSLEEYVVSVREVEERTGLNFFSHLSRREQDRLETENHSEKVKPHFGRRILQ